MNQAAADDDTPFIYGAPWGPLLQGMTILSVVLLLGMTAMGVSERPAGQLLWYLVMIVLPLVMLVTAVFFMIRGYLLYADTLYVRRLGWYSKIPLAGLQHVVFDPEVTRKMTRRFGNGGMFCFAGSYKSKKIGPVRVFATDLRRPVVLRFADRSIIVTPDDPIDFVEKVKLLRSL